MSDKRQQTAVQPAGPASLPAALVSAMEADTSVDALKAYRIMPRLVVMQKSHSTEAHSKIGPPGTVFLGATGIPMAALGEKWSFIPVFFFTEYVIEKDRDDTASPKILDRTFDASSELAQRCKDKSRWNEPYGSNPKKPIEGKQGEFEPFIARHVETQNYCIIVDGGNFDGQPAIMQFAKGEFTTGQGFSTLIQTRKLDADGQKVQAPLWYCRFDVSTSSRKRDDNEWFGYDVVNPTENPYIPESAIAQFQKENLDLADDFAKKLVRVDDTDVADAGAKEAAKDIDPSKRKF